MKLAILISGRGSNMEAVIRSSKSGVIPAEVGLVLSNRADAPGLKKAETQGVKSFFLDPSQFSGRDDYDRKIVHILKSEKIDFVFLAGFMRILSPHFIQSYRNRIINIHPALLPSFPGLNAQKQALDYGVRFTGATTHMVDEGVDSGPIIMQSVVGIDKRDTVESLSKKILKEEHIIATLALKAFAEGRLKIEGRKVEIEGES